MTAAGDPGGATATLGRDPSIDPSWHAVLAEEFQSDYLGELRTFLGAERRAGHEVYPPRSEIIAAFKRTPFDAVRVVIVGQDPYHGPGQAMGLSFSVPRGVRQPPSLRNVLTEVEVDTGVTRPASGDLSHWAGQGVLLINSSLTVRAREAGSHAGRGWERFTNAAIRAVAEQRTAVVFLLWGHHARRAGSMIDRARHLVLEAAHPSPLSAHNGFFGCRHFSQANAYLVEHGQLPIDWSLPG